MTIQHETLSADTPLFEDDATWCHLYQTLRTPVRYWVYTHMVPSWVGQEDDIIEDIIQETFLRTWNYLRKGEQGQATPVNSLPQFCKTIALNYSKDLWRRDRHLAPAGGSRWEYSVLVFEIAEDPQDIAVERVWQDEIFVCVANAVTRFPDKQRKALLTDLACRMDFHESSTPLRQAFSQVGIQLEEYQRLPSRDAVERNRYLTSLSTAYKRLRNIILECEAAPRVNQAMKRQQELPTREDLQYDPGKVSAEISMFLFVSSSLGVENMSSQAIAQTKTLDTEQHEAFTREITDMDKPEQEQADNLEEQDASMILEDPDLAMLALYLRQTSPPIVDPAYREALQSKLLQTVLAQRQRKGRMESGPESNSAPGSLALPETYSLTGADTKEPTDESETAALEDDAELAALAYHLQQTVPAVPIDPKFQEALQEELLDVVRKRRPSCSANRKRSQSVLALVCGAKC